MVHSFDLCSRAAFDRLGRFGIRWRADERSSKAEQRCPVLHQHQQQQTMTKMQRMQRRLLLDHCHCYCCCCQHCCCGCCCCHFEQEQHLRKMQSKRTIT